MTPEKWVFSEMLIFVDDTNNSTYYSFAWSVSNIIKVHTSFFIDAFLLVTIIWKIHYEDNKETLANIQFWILFLCIGTVFVLYALSTFPWCVIQCQAYVGKIWNVQIEERICYNIPYAHQKCTIFLRFNNRLSMQLDTAIVQLISVMNMYVCM